MLMLRRTAVRQWLVLIALLLGGFTFPQAAWSSSDSPGPAFEVSFSSSIRQQPVAGRLYVMISRTNDPEVRLQSHWFNSPQIVALDVHDMKPGEKVVLDASVLGFPFRSLAQLPAGEYFVQAVLNVYTRFRRADGHVVLAHMDQWEGQQFNKSPGNLYSRVVKRRLDAGQRYRFELSLTEIIPPITMPADTEWVRYIRIQSDRLTRFWGHPIYLGAVVLLPKGYASRPNVRYPVIYHQPGHFSLRAPFSVTLDEVKEKEHVRRARELAGFETGRVFADAWFGEEFPRMIAVSLLHPTPFADMSGVLDSANNGPYGEAIMQELLPYIEQQFRIIREPYARLLVGKASGGRDALNLQLRGPEFFGGGRRVRIRRRHSRAGRRGWISAPAVGSYDGQD